MKTPIYYTRIGGLTAFLALSACVPNNQGGSTSSSTSTGTSTATSTHTSTSTSTSTSTHAITCPWNGQSVAVGNSVTA